MALGTATLEETVRARVGAAPFSAAAVRDGELLAVRHTPAEPDFPIWSLTKTFLATLTLLAARDGLLDLDDALGRYRSDVPDAGRITLRQLLQHSAGLPDYGALPAYRAAVAQRARPWSFDGFADATYRRGLLFPPGAGWHYANPGYALVAALLEQVRGAPLAELVRLQIAEPLALLRTRVVDTLDDSRICPATSSQLDPDGLPRPVKTCYAVGWVWHRLIVADAADCARFLDALLRREWLGSAPTRAMTALVTVPGSHPPWSRPGYGLGLMGESAGPRGPLYGHNGDGPGFAASAFHRADTGTSIAVLAALEGSDRTLDAVLAAHDLAAE